MPTTYRLVRPERSVVVPELDDEQRRVVEHPGGPLLVLAGPGTGKTTTLVEAIVDRIENRGARPEEVLALTFSRKAAEQLRDRVTARLGRTMTSGLAATFHSFAYGLVRHYAPSDLYSAPLRLLAAPEQDVVLRELLTDHPESVTWPAGLRRALGTRGFAREVNAVLSRAREKRLDGDDLQALGVEHDLPEMVAAGLFLEQYLTTLDDLGATDYADLIRRAQLEAADHRNELRDRYEHVFVDEYQDTDPGQVALLRELAGDGRDLTVVGDPHQSIYAFRGAEVRGILEFPQAFTRSDGRPADVVALRTTRRFGSRLLRTSQAITGRLTLPGAISEAAKEAFLHPRSAGDLEAGRVEVLTFDTERAEAEHLADLLRRAHLEDGIDWCDMAVLVRSGRTSIPPLRRSLNAAGVPVEVTHDEVPLVRDPAVLPLLDALRAVVNLDNDDPTHVDFLHPTRVEALLLGPLGDFDAGELRRLGRLLRDRAKRHAHDDGALTPTSRDLVRSALVEPGFLDGLDDVPAVRHARRLAGLLAGARALLDDGVSAEQVLWHLWSGTDWPERLRRTAELGGPGAQRADRDLDSVCALFEAVARVEEQRVHVGVPALLAGLAAQQIPADTLAERGARGAAVRLLTAHRSKGLEWRLVVVAHVQQEAWPDLRHRASLLRPDRLGERGSGLAEPATPSEMLREERRLFYVACTRARERLVVTAVASPDDDGEQPSRFLAEIDASSGGPERRHAVGRPPRPLTLAGVVADLRRHASDLGVPEPLRRAAARRLASLAAERVGSRALVPAADPDRWWGVRETTRAPEPLRDPDRPVPVSASLLGGVLTCPTRWFLEREAGGVSRAHQSANLGQLVHALAERVASESLGADAQPEAVPSLDDLMGHVDEVWGRLEFRTPWSKQREHDRTRAALARFMAWHHDNLRRLVGVEQDFHADVTVDDPRDPDGAPIAVRLTGYADRVEIDTEGSVVVVDLKTGRNAPSGPSVQSDHQLALYQYAVEAGAVDALVPGLAESEHARPGGAALVQLGLTGESDTATVQAQEAPDPDGPTRAELRRGLGRAAAALTDEVFPATAGDHCRDCGFVSICPVQGAGSVIGP